MRAKLLLIPAIALGLAAIPAFATAADATPAAAADVAGPVNTVDPVTGAKVDAKFAPIEAKTADGKTVWIAVASEESATKVKADPAKYVKAAIGNTTVDAK